MILSLPAFLRTITSLPTSLIGSNNLNRGNDNDIANDIVNVKANENFDNGSDDSNNNAGSSIIAPPSHGSLISVSAHMLTNDRAFARIECIASNNEVIDRWCSSINPGRDNVMSCHKEEQQRVPNPKMKMKH